MMVVVAVEVLEIAMVVSVVCEIVVVVDKADAAVAAAAAAAMGAGVPVAVPRAVVHLRTVERMTTKPIGPVMAGAIPAVVSAERAQRTNLEGAANAKFALQIQLGAKQ